MSFFGGGNSRKAPLLTSPGPALPRVGAQPHQRQPTPVVDAPPDPGTSTSLAASTSVGAALAAAAKQRKKAMAGTSLITAPPIKGPKMVGAPRTLIGY